MLNKNFSLPQILFVIISVLSSILLAVPIFASEAELNIPVLSDAQNNILMIGFIICLAGMGFGLYEYTKVKGFPAHKSMLDVSEIIFQTCKNQAMRHSSL